jgi:hypothetical protein
MVSKITVLYNVQFSLTYLLGRVLFLDILQDLKLIAFMIYEGVSIISGTDAAICTTVAVAVAVAIQR